MASRRPTTPRGPRRGRPSSSPSASSAGASRTGSRRPAHAPRPRTASPARPEPPRGLTRRAAVLAVLLLVAAVVLAPYIRMLAEQQAAISSLEAEIAEREQKVDDLAAELERWQDPAFVTARARERLFMVMPGETGYVVLDPPSQEEISPEGAASVVQAAEEGGEVRPWFGALWESIELAGAEPLPGAEPATGPEGEAEDGGDDPPLPEGEPAPEVSPVP